MNDSEFKEKSDSMVASKPQLLSVCCGAKAIGEIVEDCYGHTYGLCSECGNQTNFGVEIENE